jgi:hypothetical protein
MALDVREQFRCGSLTFLAASLTLPAGFYVLLALVGLAVAESIPDALLAGPKHLLVPAKPALKGTISGHLLRVSPQDNPQAVRKISMANTVVRVREIAALADIVATRG